MASFSVVRSKGLPLNGVIWRTTRSADSIFGVLLDLVWTSVRYYFKSVLAIIICQYFEVSLI